MAVSSLKLNTGAEIPQIGFGLWQVLPEHICEQSVENALEAGFRHFDTAQDYKNEQYLGAAIKKSDFDRSKLFITTKIWIDNFGQNDLFPSFDESLKKLQTDYVDLLLLHFPVAEIRRSAWHKMEEIYASGRAKAIGVSNYMVNHLEELLNETKIVPAVNQIELHVFLQMPEVVEYCQKKGIIIEAYSPLAHAKKMEHPTLNKIAKKYGKTNAQIMLRWCIDIGTVPLPKSTHSERIKENIDIFDFKLDKDDMSVLAKLESNLRTCWDPTNVP